MGYPNNYKKLNSIARKKGQVWVRLARIRPFRLSGRKTELFSKGELEDERRETYVGEIIVLKIVLDYCVWDIMPFACDIQR